MTTVVNGRAILGPYLVGEIPEPWVPQLTDNSGTPINITGFTGVVQYERPDGTDGTRAATILDAPTGKWRVAWTAADFTQAGVYKATLWVGNGGSYKPGSRCDIRVRRAPGGAAPTI